jgi:hypothetical protein
MMVTMAMSVPVVMSVPVPMPMPMPIIMRASGGGTVAARVCVAVMMRVTHGANLAVAPGRDQNRRSARLPTPP